MNIIESNFNFGALNNRSTTNKIITHHADAISCTVLDINQWHKNNGWSGIGYHFFIRKDGSIYRGRPIDTVGAHTLGQNSDSIGICFEGKFTQEKPTNEQIQSLKELISYLKNIYGNIPVKGHMDYTATDCPGSLMDYMSELNGCVNGSCTIPVQDVAQNLNSIEYLQHELNLQFSAGLIEDNIAGPITLSKCPLVKCGAQGNITKWIQLHVGADSDGIFGPNTLNAVQQFQKSNGLQADGIVGPNTWRKLLGL